MERKTYNTVIVKNAKSGRMESICLDTGEVLNALTVDDMEKYKFSRSMGLLICQKIREGATLKELSEDPSLPSLSVIHYWRRANILFDDEIKLARKDRAEYYHDKVLEITNEVVDKDDVPVAKFKTDQYKWAAEKGDPSSYGNKIEHSGSNSAPTLVVMTGIQRMPDVEVTYEEVPDTGQVQQNDGSGREDILGDDQEEAGEDRGPSGDGISSAGGEGSPEADEEDKS